MTPTQSTSMMLTVTAQKQICMKSSILVKPLLLSVMFAFVMDVPGAQSDPISITRAGSIVLARAVARNVSNQPEEDEQLETADTLGSVSVTAQVSNGQLSRASITNTVVFANSRDLHGFEGTGEYNAVVDTVSSGYTFSNSIIESEVRLQTPHTVDFLGNFITSGPGGAGYFQAGVTTNGSVIFEAFSRATSFGTFTERTDLTAGTYGLFFAFVGGLNGDTPGVWETQGNFDYRIRLSETAPTPEPESLMLVGIGLVGLATALRRQLIT